MGKKKTAKKTAKKHATTSTATDVTLGIVAKIKTELPSLKYEHIPRGKAKYPHSAADIKKYVDDLDELYARLRMAYQNFAACNIPTIRLRARGLISGLDEIHNAVDHFEEEIISELKVVAGKK